MRNTVAGTHVIRPRMRLLVATTIALTFAAACKPNDAKRASAANPQLVEPAVPSTAPASPAPPANAGLPTAELGWSAALGWNRLGAFELPSGRAIVSDPAYGDASAMIRDTLDVRAGTWASIVRISDEHDMGTRAAELLVFHRDADADALSWRDAGFMVGVDSGTAGVFDIHSFRDDADSSAEAKATSAKSPGKAGDTWYESYVMEGLASRRNHAIALRSGVISASGFGDGGYKCLVGEGTTGKIEGIRIVFIGEGKDGDEVRKLAREVFSKAL